MKKYNKYIKSTLVYSLSVLFFAGCSENTMDGINNNNNNPLNTEAKFLITELETGTAFSAVGGDLSTYASVYMEHEVGSHNQMYNAELRNGEPTSSTTYNNTWESAYANIKKAKLVIKKCSPGGPEEGSDVTLGIAKVLLAYNAAILTDLFGDVPYSQAGVLDEDGLPVYWQPVLDKQESIYADIFKNLDEAIVLFEGEKDKGVYGAVGKKDFIYGGDPELWKKATYGLKARYKMRLLERSTNKTQDLNNILDYISESFESADEELKYAIYDGSSQTNPLAAFSDARGALAASKSFAEKLKERNDPRYSQIYMKYSYSTGEFSSVTDMSKLRLAPNGDDEHLIETQLEEYDVNVTDNSYAAPTQLLSYHELLFLKAEALARIGTDIPAAETALKDAITAAFANLQNSIVSTVDAYSGVKKANLSSTVSDAYFVADVKALFDAAPLKEIMVQKYLAFMGASGESIEAYNDYRRQLAAGETFVILANPYNVTKFPLRFVYGNSDVLANPNIGGIVGDGTYVYKEKVWWAGGTR